MTTKTATTLVRALGCSLRYRDAEYRVNFQGGDEATAYYTNDIHDAIYTAVAMHRSRRCSTRSAKPMPHVLFLTVGTRDDNRGLVSLWDDPYSRERGKDDGDRLVDLDLTAAQRLALFS